MQSAYNNRVGAPHTCATCAHYSPSRDNETGRCRVNPPTDRDLMTEIAEAINSLDHSQIGDHRRIGGRWPMVLPHDWCGAYHGIDTESPDTDLQRIVKNALSEALWIAADASDPDHREAAGLIAEALQMVQREVSS